jgi:hypothetical protein
MRCRAAPTYTSKNTLMPKGVFVSALDSFPLEKASESKQTGGF